MVLEKIQKIQASLRAQKIDALFLANPGHQVADDVLYYIILQRLESGIMVIPARGRATLFTIPFEANDLGRQYPDIHVQPMRGSLGKMLSSFFSQPSTLGIRPSALPTSLMADLKKIARLKTVTWEGDKAVMAIKMPQEIVRLEKACRLTDRLFRALIKSWPQYKTEVDAARFLLTSMAELGIEASFPPIIASGASTGDPHARPRQKKIQPGFCVIDMGVRVDGYCSDMTRTVYVGTPSDRERVLYRTLAAVQRQTAARVAAGTTTGALDAFCRTTLGNELNKQFIHGLGHGVGTQVHEWPRVGHADETVLEAGMIITIEPGIYEPNRFGMRIEDDVLVTKTGQRILNRSPKTLILVQP